MNERDGYTITGGASSPFLCEYLGTLPFPYLLDGKYKVRNTVCRSAHQQKYLWALWSHLYPLEYRGGDWIEVTRACGGSGSS